MTLNPYRATLAAIVVSLGVACSPSGAKAGLDAAMQADRDFAAMVKKDGPKAAFLHYLDPVDSEFIEPGVVNKGADTIAAGFDQIPPGFTIEWAPDSGHASASGDLAWTSGSYTVKLNGAAIDAGRYITGWRKAADGAWKVVIDSRIPDPPPPASRDADPQGRPG
jgi:ketosteroid isomerase-like protein